MVYFLFFLNPGSLEEVVENLEKHWESEASHKMAFEQWETVNPSEYCMATNGGPVIAGRDAKEMGNHNALLKGCPAYEKRKRCRLFLFSSSKYILIGKKPLNQMAKY